MSKKRAAATPLPDANPSTKKSQKSEEMVPISDVFKLVEKIATVQRQMVEHKEKFEQFTDQMSQYMQINGQNLDGLEKQMTLQHQKIEKLLQNMGADGSVVFANQPLNSNKADLGQVTLNNEEEAGEQPEENEELEQKEASSQQNENIPVKDPSSPSSESLKEFAAPEASKEKIEQVAEVEKVDVKSSDRHDILRMLRPEGKRGKFSKFSNEQLLYITDPAILDKLSSFTQPKMIEHFLGTEIFKGFEGPITQPVFSSIMAAFGISQSRGDKPKGIEKPKVKMESPVKKVAKNATIHKYIVKTKKAQEDPTFEQK